MARRAQDLEPNCMQPAFSCSHLDKICSCREVSLIWFDCLSTAPSFQAGWKAQDALLAEVESQFHDVLHE